MHFDVQPEISIHSLHTEGDSALYFLSPSTLLFQSTPSTRRETLGMGGHYIHWTFQSTPSTRRETGVVFSVAIDAVISIHSLHTEGDNKVCYNRTGGVHFNPLPPHGGRPSSASVNFRSMSFQSTPSTRRETTNDGRSRSDKRFQSTPSTRRETLLTLSRDDAFLFQSTPSTRRETSILPGGWITRNHFNPLPPHGGRHFPKTHSP